MAAPPPPPPRRTATPSSSSAPPTPEPSTWSSRMKAKGAVWGKKAMDKSVVISDKVGTRVNDIAEKRFGTEHFWPVTGDMPKEMDKCARILRAFTVEGIVKEEKVDIKEANGEGPAAKEKKKKTYKVLRKIPPDVIAQAKGIAIFSSFRSGIAPLGGAGGSGLVLAKLPDGTWSAPASISPNNLSTGFLIGVDVYDCVLIIRSQSALDSFSSHKFTLGTEIGVAAGPYGAGAAVEAGTERAPVFSYVRSRGMYAGVEVVGQVFVERFDENAAMYHWPGVKAGDILQGKVKVPLEAAALHQALRDAETGKAQREKGESLDTILSDSKTADLELGEGEVLKLPPTPDQTDGTEYNSDPETHVVHRLSNSHSRTASGTHTPFTSHGQGLGVGMLPPQLPTRPAPVSHLSSTSHYSNAEEGDDLPPPGYESGAQGNRFGRDEKQAKEEQMSAGERREWDEFYAQQAEQQAGPAEGAVGTTHVGQELRSGVESLHIAPDASKPLHDESLR